MIASISNSRFCNRDEYRIGVAVAVLSFWTAAFSVAHADDADGVRFFREKIEPVWKAQCYLCHSRQAEEVKGGLRLDFKAGVLRGGDSGPAVVAG